MRKRPVIARFQPDDGSGGKPPAETSIKRYRSILLTGTITLVTGYTVSYAGTARQNFQPLPRDGGALTIPGRNIRGKFRHCAYDMVRERLLADRNERMRLADVFFYVLGGVRQKKEATYDHLRVRPKLRRHAFQSLFGCFDPIGLRGNLQCEAAIASTAVQATRLYGQRSDPIQRGEVEPEHLENPDEFDLYIAKLEPQRKAREALKEARKNGTRKGRNDTPPADAAEPPEMPANMPFEREIIPSGTEMHHTMQIRNPSDAEIGLLFATFRHFAHDPQFGAQIGLNLGVVDVFYNVILDGDKLGTVSITGRDGKFVMTPALMRFEEAWWEEFKNLSFRMPDFKDDDPE